MHILRHIYLQKSEFSLKSNCEAVLFLSTSNKHNIAKFADKLFFILLNNLLFIMFLFFFFF